MVAKDTLFERIEHILREEFPTDTVDISPGYHDNIHVVVVSRRFDNMGEKEKQDYLWTIIDRSNLKKSEKKRISLILPYSPVELK